MNSYISYVGNHRASNHFHLCGDFSTSRRECGMRRGDDDGGDDDGDDGEGNGNIHICAHTHVRTYKHDDDGDDD